MLSNLPLSTPTLNGVQAVGEEVMVGRGEVPDEDMEEVSVEGEGVLDEMEVLSVVLVRVTDTVCVTDILGRFEGGSSIYRSREA